MYRAFSAPDLHVLPYIVKAVNEFNEATQRKYGKTTQNIKNYTTIRALVSDSPQKRIGTIQKKNQKKTIGKVNISRGLNRGRKHTESPKMEKMKEKTAGVMTELLGFANEGGSLNKKDSKSKTDIRRYGSTNASSGGNNVGVKKNNIPSTDSTTAKEVPSDNTTVPNGEKATTDKNDAAKDLTTSEAIDDNIDLAFGHIPDSNDTNEMEQEPHNKKRGRGGDSPVHEQGGKKTIIEAVSTIVHSLQNNENMTLETVKTQCFEAIAQVQAQLIQLQTASNEFAAKVQKETDWNKLNLENVRKEYPAKIDEVMDYCTQGLNEAKKTASELDGRLMTAESKIGTLAAASDKIANKVEQQNQAIKELNKQFNMITLKDANTPEGQGSHTTQDREVGATTSAFLLIGLTSIKKFLDIPADSDPVETVGRILDENHLYASLDKVIPADLKTAKYRSKSNIAIVYMRNEFMKKEALISLKNMANRNRSYLGDVVIKDSFHPTKIQEMRELTKQGMALKENKQISKYRIINKNGEPVLQVSADPKGRYTDYKENEQMIIDVEDTSSTTSDEENSIQDRETREIRKKAREEKRKAKKKNTPATGGNSTPMGKGQRTKGSNTYMGNSNQPASISTRSSYHDAKDNGARKKTGRFVDNNDNRRTHHRTGSPGKETPRGRYSSARGTPRRWASDDRSINDAEEERNKLQKDLNDLAAQFKAFKEATETNKTQDPGAVGYTREG